MPDSWQIYEVFDHPSITGAIFYPRQDEYEVPDTAESQGVTAPAADGVDISCRFFNGGKENANMLFFHGNGELASEYDDIGQAFNGIGINLFVADYRGYGRSGGCPTVSGMIKDAPFVAARFGAFLQEKGYAGKRFIMGRSMGSASALWLAAERQPDFSGLVVESGFCDVADLLARAGLPGGRAAFPAPGLQETRKITMPALIIHGEYDSIVPLAEGQKIYSNLGSTDKRMLVIPRADHNSVFAYGMREYLGALSVFVSKG